VNDPLSHHTTQRTIETLEAVYRAFEMQPPSAIEGCPCCIATRGADVLLTTPLRHITGQALWRYVSGAFLTVGGLQDFRYLLPRILDVSVTDPGNANACEIVLGKLSLAQWRLWPAHEQAAIKKWPGSRGGGRLPGQDPFAGLGWPEGGERRATSIGSMRH
jgi:hypothetical protein